MTATLPSTAETVPQPTVDPASAEPAPGGASLRTSLVEQGYVPAHFGGIPVLVGPKLAVQLRSLRGERP